MSDGSVFGFWFCEVGQGSPYCLREQSGSKKMMVPAQDTACSSWMIALVWGVDCPVSHDMDSVVLVPYHKNVFPFPPLHSSPLPSPSLFPLLTSLHPFFPRSSSSSFSSPPSPSPFLLHCSCHPSVLTRSSVLCSGPPFFSCCVSKSYSAWDPTPAC